MKSLISPLAAVALLALASPVCAGPLEDIFYPPDANGIVPIERVLDQARASVAGTIAEIELEHEHGRLLYEVEIKTADNREIEIEYDARTGEEVSREFKKSKQKRED